MHCIRDVQSCIDSGYYLAWDFESGGAAAGDYRIRFKLDSDGNREALAVIRDRRVVGKVVLEV